MLETSALRLLKDHRCSFIQQLLLLPQPSVWCRCHGGFEKCAPALFQHISISPLFFFLPPLCRLRLMSRQSSDALTQAFMPVQLSPAPENIPLPADFFLFISFFAVSVYNGSEAWSSTAELLNSCIHY